jgi:hypothetical protein
VYPYDDDVTTDLVTEVLEQLEELQWIARYVAADGGEYIQILNWWDTQRLFAGPSKYPAPTGWRDRLRITATKGQIVTHNWTNRDGTQVPDTCDDRGNPLAGVQAGVRTAEILDMTKVANGRVPPGAGATAVEVYYEVFATTFSMHRYTAERLVTTVTDLKLWREVVSTWALRKYRATNIEGMLDWYFKGGPPRAGKDKTNGQRDASSTPARRVATVDGSIFGP